MAAQQTDHRLEIHLQRESVTPPLDRKSIEAETSGSAGGSLSVLAGPDVTVIGISSPSAETQVRTALLILPCRPLVVGRAEGSEVPYLDPAYRPTVLVPHSGQNILRDEASDQYISRGHFMLWTTANGIQLLNGVPRRGGGIRPPANGTRLLKPIPRDLEPGEIYLIECGATIVLELPNGSVIEIAAE